MFEFFFFFFFFFFLLFWMNLWSRVLLEKLIVTQFVKTLLASYGTRKFITVFIRIHHWILS
jgi:hypothetical protein